MNLIPSDRDAAVTPTPSTGQKASTFSRQSRRRALGTVITGGLTTAMTMMLTRPDTAAAHDVFLPGLDTAPAAAAVPSQPDIFTALCATFRQADEAWSEWLAEWHTEYEQLQTRRDEITEKLEAVVPDKEEFRRLLRNLDDSAGDMSIHSADRERELVIRHMPGLEPVLRLVFAHAITTWFDAEHKCADGQCSEQCW